MKIFNKLLLSVLLLPTFAFAIESSCNNTVIELFNNSGSDLMVLDIDMQSTAAFKFIAERDVIKAGDRRDIKLASGQGTFGSIRGTITLIEDNGNTITSELKFLHLNINFENNYVRCTKNVTISQANYNKFTAYVVPGFHQNIKVFIVGTKKMAPEVEAAIAKTAIANAEIEATYSPVSVAANANTA